MPWAILILFLGMGSTVFACGDLVDELKSMQRAQQAMLGGLTDNHETFAQAVEDLVSDVEMRSGEVPESALQSMRKTAQAFRRRGTQSRQSVAKMDAATTNLIQRIEKCLSEGTRK